MEKRGELSSAQIIGLVLAIVGFVIVLILLTSLDFNSYSAEETCKLSVLTRATLPSNFNQLVPLKCTTKKICITDSVVGGKCEKFSGEENVESVKLKSDAGESAKVIEEATANAMYECWNMMGQGKLDLFSGVDKPLSNVGGQIFKEFGFDGTAATSCVICSRIAFDDDINKKNLDEISGKLDVNEYMASEKVPDGSGATYLQAMSDRGVNSYPAKFKEEISSGKSKGSREIGIVFMQILTEEDPLKAFENTALRSGAFIFGGSAVLSSGGSLVRAGANSVTGIFTNFPLFLTKIGIALGVGGLSAVETYHNQQISAGYCGGFTSTAKDARHGCSIVSAVDYNNIDAVNKLCGTIEGAP